MYRPFIPLREGHSQYGILRDFGFTMYVQFAVEKMSYFFNNN
jgi:hypothetical protein